MAPSADQTGLVSFSHQALDQEAQTYYRIIGDLKSGQRPLIAAHGGPGSSHDYFLDPLASFPEETGRPVVLYDQVGNAKSTNFSMEKPPADLSVEVYTAELDNLVSKLGIDEFDFLGHSWGGMMGLEYVIKYKPNIKHLILDSVPASMKLWTKTIKATMDELEPADRDLAFELDSTQQYQDPRLQAIMMKVQSKHVCRMDPWPEAAQGFFGVLMANPAVYGTMLGPSQFETLGKLKGWSVEGRCKDIKIPTLMIHGEYDWADQDNVKPIVDQIENCRQVTMKGCSHMCHLEDTAEFKKQVLAFLNN